jgi:hypothetical protein
MQGDEVREGIRRNIVWAISEAEPDYGQQQSLRSIPDHATNRDSGNNAIIRPFHS